MINKKVRIRPDKLNVVKLYMFFSDISEDMMFEVINHRIVSSLYVIASGPFKDYCIGKDDFYEISNISFKKEIDRILLEEI